MDDALLDRLRPLIVDHFGRSVEPAAVHDELVVGTSILAIAAHRNLVLSRSALEPRLAP